MDWFIKSLIGLAFVLCCAVLFKTGMSIGRYEGEKDGFARGFYQSCAPLKSTLEILKMCVKEVTKDTTPYNEPKLKLLK